MPAGKGPRGNQAQRPTAVTVTSGAPGWLLAAIARKCPVVSSPARVTIQTPDAVVALAETVGCVPGANGAG